MGDPTCDRHLRGPVRGLRRPHTALDDVAPCRLQTARRRSAKRLNPLPDPVADVVLGHVAILVPKQLLRVARVAGVAGSLRANVAKLEADSSRLARLVESRAQC